MKKKSNGIAKNVLPIPKMIVPMNIVPANPENERALILNAMDPIISEKANPIRN
jgi:hypothetical protein